MHACMHACMHVKFVCLRQTKWLPFVLSLAVLALAVAAIGATHPATTGVTIFQAGSTRTLSYLSYPTRALASPRPPALVREVLL